MRNYVIINGVNSLTIQGLAINNLPPITKPMIRTQREEIDGRDGDIVTELGYSAYDKQMEIGLYGNFDIDAIIKYFTGEGTIVFSNEDDKYYNFKILDQIDYEKLLKFKTAVVTFHCQPFKYPLEEEPVEAEITTITGTGEYITLEDTEEAPMDIVYKGNTYQYSTSGKNLLNIPDGTQESNGITFVAQNGEITINGTASNTAFYQLSIDIPVTAEKYSWSANNPVSSNGVTLRFNGNAGNVMSKDLVSVNETNTTNFETANTLGYFVIRVTSGTTLTNFKIKPQFEKGNPTSYEPYTNGASPNPVYPQDMHIVSGDNSIKVEGEGKNLLDKSTISAGDITGSPTNIRYTTFQNLWLNAGTYTFSSNITSPFRYAIQGQKVSAPPVNPFPSLEFNSGWLTSSTLEYTFTLTTGMWIDLCISKENNATLTLEEAKQFNYQLEVGNQATSYEPYTGASYPINLPVENYLKYPYATSTTTTSGITFTDNGKGTITINGTATANAYFNLYNNQTGQRLKLAKGTYTFSNNNLMPTGCNMTLGVRDSSGNPISGVGNFVLSSSTSSVTRTIDQDFEIFGNIYIPNGTTISDFEVKPMLEKGSVVHSFTPYGEYIELCKIGTYQDKIDKSTGKNLCSPFVIGKGLNSSTGAEITDSVRSVTDFIPVDFNKNQYYYVSGLPTTLYGYVAAYNSNKVFLGRTNAGDYATFYLGTNSFTNGTPQGTGDIAYLRITQYESGSTTGTINDIDKALVMLNTGSTALPYEPYGTSWYLKKEIGKVVLNGSEDWRLYSQSGSSVRRFGIQVIIFKDNTTGFSNYFLVENNKGTNATQNVLFLQDDGHYLGIADQINTWNDTNALKTFLSSNNTEVYYVLATPTYTLIEGELLNQLEAIKMSYEGQTNLSQTNNDLAFELDASVTFLSPMGINNIGNIYAKPILTIEGTGNIGVILNGIQILEIDLSNNGKITIDVPKLEAYDPDDDTLLNRLVTGDYMKLLINEGENKITFTGEVSGATLTNYIRWI